MTSPSPAPGPDPTITRRCKAMAKRTGVQCEHRAMLGQEVCRVHGGKSPRAMAAAKRRLAVEEVRREAARLGGSLEVHPLDVLLDSVGEAAANVAVLRSAIADLGVHVGEDGIAVPERVIEFEKGGTHVAAREHILVAMYNAERERQNKWSKMCLDAGVDERKVRLKEEQGQVLGKALDAAVTSAAYVDAVQAGDLSGARAALRVELAREIRSLGGGA